MSIWCSNLSLGDDGWLEEHPAPIIYQQSHVLPSMTDPRGGTLNLATIPPWITRDGRCLAGRDCAHETEHTGCCEYLEQPLHWPYLRMTLRTTEYPDGVEWAWLENLAETIEHWPDAAPWAPKVSENELAETAALLRRCAAPEDTIILDRNQVAELRDTLDEWLAAAPKDPT